MFALESAFERWLGRKPGPEFQAKLLNAKACAERGKRIAPKDHRFHLLLGIVHDVEGKHEQARSEFRTSGALRSDPYWRLAMATSWGMSGQPKEGLAEVRRAIEKGAKYWVVDFYLGRALCQLGEYDEAIPHLIKALQQSKWQPQVLAHLNDAHYFQGHFDKAAGYLAREGVVFLRGGRLRGALAVCKAAFLFLLHLMLVLSKRLWRVSRHVPVLRNIHKRLSSPAEPEATLGFRLVQHGHYRFAEKHLRKACEILPDSPRILTNLAACLAFQDKRAEAVEMCDRAIRCASDEVMLGQLKQNKIRLESDGPARPKRIVLIQ